jgi:hypothetical protein
MEILYFDVHFQINQGADDEKQDLIYSSIRYFIIGV